MCTSNSGKPFMMGGLMPGNYLSQMGVKIKNANSAPVPAPPPAPAPPANFAQNIRPYALGRNFTIPTANVRSR